MKKLLFVLSIIVVLFLIPNQARADTVFSDFPADYSYNNNSGWTISGNSSTVGITFWSANAFTPLFNSYVFDNIKLAIANVKGTNQIHVTLYGDNSGKPDTSMPIEAFSFSNLGNFGNDNPPNPLLTANSSVHPVLNEGAQYWLVATPGDSTTWAAWNFNTANFIGSPEYSEDGGVNWIINGSQPLAAFEIDGTPGVTNPTVPEPATMLLFGIGGAAMAFISKKKKLS